MDRRYFLMSTAAAAGALKASTLASPNDTVRVACVGVRGQGRAHIQVYSRMPNVEIAALCDVDETILDDRLQLAEKLTKKKPARFIDMRKLLEDKSIDAISIATPNHWHTLLAIWAMQAGKDVYVEKPCSYNLYECKQIMAARKKYNRIVQHGTNSRSGVAVQQAVKQMRDGLIGDIYLARGLCFKWRDTIGHTPVEPVPAGVHYDLWTGPAPKHEFTRNRFHYNWHWFWDYGNGDLGNQGIHELDVARWGLGVTYPTKATAIGGHFMFDDDQETPNTLTALYEFDGSGTGKRKMMEFGVRHWISNHEGGIDEGDLKAERVKGRIRDTIGNVFYGSKGYLCVEGYGRYWSVLGPIKQEAAAPSGPSAAGPSPARPALMEEPGPSMSQGGNNWANFIQAVRSRKYEELNAPIEEGAASAALIHLANISYRLGRSVNFDAKSWTCPGDAEATKMMTRREGYRKPFVVPEKV